MYECVLCVCVYVGLLYVSMCMCGMWVVLHPLAFTRLISSDLSPAHLCRAYPFPGSIAMTAFLHAYLFRASFGSSWCSFISLRNLSIHLILGLPRGLFLPSSSVLLTLQHSCLLFSLHGHTTKCVTYVVIGLTIASTLNFSF